MQLTLTNKKEVLMTEATKQAVQMTTEAESEEILISKERTVVVGGELVGKKMTGLVLALLQRFKDSCPNMIMFRNDDYPRGVLGMAYADTMSVAINLNKCWRDACMTAEAGKVYLGLPGIYWLNVLGAVIHEMSHIQLASQDRDTYEELRRTDEASMEEAADNDVLNNLIWLAKKIDMEIPSDISQIGWAGAEMMGLFLNEDRKEEGWVVRARNQISNGVVYEDPVSGDVCNTLREFVKKAYTNDDKNAEDWEQAVTPIIVEGMLEDGTPFKATAHEVANPEPAVAETTQQLFLTESPAAQDTLNITDTTVTQAPVFLVDPDGQATPKDLFAGNVPVPPVATETTQVPVPPVETTNPFQVPLPNGVMPTAEAMNANGNLPTCTMKAENRPAFLKEVWQRLYHHIFTKCGWAPGANGYQFTNIAAALQPVDLSDIVKRYGAEGFIISYRTTASDTFTMREETFEGSVKGQTFTNKNLVGYTLFLNIDGNVIKRTLLPQNPAKKDGSGQLKPMAAAARQGNVIAWVYKGEAPRSGATFQEIFAVKIVNNQYEVIG
jgi:hypothetical protein